jgi:hypothetical protein
MIIFIFIWFFLAVLIGFGDNSYKLFKKNNIPLNFKGGFSVPNWRIKQVIDECSENELLVKKLKIALLCSRISSFLYFSFILVFLILFLLRTIFL